MQLTNDYIKEADNNRATNKQLYKKKIILKNYSGDEAIKIQGFQEWSDPDQNAFVVKVNMFKGFGISK